MVKDNENRIEHTAGYSDEIDIESILNEPKKEFHFEDGIAYMCQVDQNMSTYNKTHKLSIDKAGTAKNKLARRNRKRTLETIIAAGLIIIVGIFFALVLYPQAELSELSRDNSDRKDEIAKLKKEILDAKSDSDGITDMDSIRAQAMALGMQEPNSNQVVHIPLPGSDRLVTVATYDSNGIDDDALEVATENLADYYHEVDARD